MEMERRGRGSGRVTHVRCRECSAPVLLDPTQMDTEGDPVTLRCEACGASVPVRQFDAEWDSGWVDFEPRGPRRLWVVAPSSADAERDASNTRDRSLPEV